MRLPILNTVSKNREMMSAFGGYHHDLVISDNEFYDEENLSSDSYPALTPREQRKKIRDFTRLDGFCVNNGLCWVDNGKVFYNGDQVSGDVEKSRKQMLSMGAYVLIWPDKKYINTEKVSEGVGSLEKSFTTTAAVSFTLTRVTGDDYNPTVSATAPEEPTNGDSWLDTSSKPHTLKIYAAATKMWNAVATTFVKISSAGIGEGFSEYDGVTISGCKDEQFNTNMILYAVSKDYIVVTGFIDEVSSQQEAVTVKRTVPDMDFVTESENRIWGCSSDKHEIYCCKIGDPFNWNCFLGLASDSYAVTVGTHGKFTGAFTMRGYILFFKEDCVHKVYGSKPSNFQVTNESIRGVQNGSERSLALCNETLYYKSRNGICAYDGGTPVNVSEAFGANAYRNAVAGAIDNKYYVSMSDEKGKYSLFTYDERTKIWHKESGLKIDAFAPLDGELYFTVGNSLWTMHGTTRYSVTDQTYDEKPVEWMAESGPIGVTSPDNKYISKLQFRLSVERGAQFRVQIQYDSMGDYEEVLHIDAVNNRTITIPIIVRRCDHMRIRMRGRGKFILYSIAKVTEQGSEI